MYSIVDRCKMCQSPIWEPFWSLKYGFRQGTHNLGVRTEKVKAPLYDTCNCPGNVKRGDAEYKGSYIPYKVVLRGAIMRFLLHPYAYIRKMAGRKVKVDVKCSG